MIIKTIHLLRRSEILNLVLMVNHEVYSMFSMLEVFPARIGYGPERQVPSPLIVDQVLELGKWRYTYQ